MTCSQCRQWQGSSIGFQWPSMTFSNSTPHPPPAHCCCFCKMLSTSPPGSPLCHSPALAVSHLSLLLNSSVFSKVDKIFSSSQIYRLSNPQKTVRLTQKEKLCIRSLSGWFSWLEACLVRVTLCAKRLWVWSLVRARAGGNQSINLSLHPLPTSFLSKPDEHDVCED